MDGLCLKAGIPSPAIGGGGVVVGAFDGRANPSQVIAAVGRGGAAATTAISMENPPAAKVAPPAAKLFFGFPLRSLWPGRDRSRHNGMAVDDAVLVDDRERAEAVGPGSGPGGASVGKNENWVLKILHVRSRWSRNEGEGESGCDAVDNGGEGEEEEEEVEEECDACSVDDKREEEVEFDSHSFSRLLRRVTLTEAKLYAQMSYLGNLAYSIPNIKARDVLRYYKLRFVTSSMDKKAQSAKSESEQRAIEVKEAEGNLKEAEESKDQKNTGYRISASAAYQIASSAASYLHSHTKSILPFKSSKGKACEDLKDGENGNANIMNSDVASLMATTDSVTAVVAAKEEVKQAVADNLNSTCSSPCEWYICDDDQTRTRFFVIQGSESLASWQANLLFEPIQFEGLDVIVHRGIYEAAKGIYEQMLPEVRAHLESHGNRSTFRFTGHSLGGSLAVLVNFMLLIRGEVPLSSLLPVITFGSPSIMCGGDRLLRKLGLPRSHVQAVTMHRDIVPRAFSCNYPNHVAELLKAVNSNFRNHPCLNNQKLLYAPMGELLILQPDEKISPHHHLLPPGSGFYLLHCPLSNANESERQILGAQMALLNSPHPLETLRDRSSYGSEGTIQRDHDMRSYVKCVRSLVRQELSRVRKAKREDRRKLWWALMMPRGGRGSAIVGRPVGLSNVTPEQLNFSGIVQTGRRSLKRFTSLVASQHMHLLVVLLFPARLVVLGAFCSIRVFH